MTQAPGSVWRKRRAVTASALAKWRWGARLGGGIRGIVPWNDLRREHVVDMVDMALAASTDPPGPFLSISGFVPRYYAMVASAERLMEVESLANDKPARGEDEVYGYYRDSLTALGLREAGFAYESEESSPVVLDGLSVEMRKGEYVAFKGHSGCGKSTVLKLLMCMYPLDRGERYIAADGGDAPGRLVAPPLRLRAPGQRAHERHDSRRRELCRPRHRPRRAPAPQGAAD